MSAISALKGYRTQILYSLHYILSTLSNDFIYRLEGEEDLDVLNYSGQLLYAIQLKNLGKTLTLSDILSDNKISFIKRFLSNYSDAIPILASYGEISKELKSWNEHKDKISEREKANLKKYKIADDDWKLVKSKIQFKEIIEEEIAEEVEKMMKDNFTLIDPIPTIGYLLNWLQFIAEKQQPITRKEFYSKVEDFGKYITERIAIHDQYGLVLKPLHKITTEGLNQKLLEKEFYNATLTRYEHILLGLDVNREKQLEKINVELKETNTIILKGASGQGKTALLYSYVYQFINDWLSFELRIQQDPVNTQKSIQAISSISKKLEIPAVFVINVNPNTTEWLQIIKESSHLNHIKFLVAIRNEDWYRATSIGVEFEHKEIDLSLSEEEATIIYSSLNKQNKILRYADFEEAWLHLGGNPPLLEFVYSITQGDSLHNKLKQQIQEILKNDGFINNHLIEFLRIVCLADSLGAKIEVSKLSKSFDYQFIIEKLENEYLIKRSSNKQYIRGLHIIRSQKLIEILLDEFTNPKEEYAYKCIPLIEEEDLYLFVLQLFHLEIVNPSRLTRDLNKKVYAKNWAEYTSLLKAFIWAGTRQYVESIRDVIDECKTIHGDAWTMLLDVLFESNFNRNELLTLMKVDEEHRLGIDNINKRLLPKQNVFNLASDLINELNCPQETPSTVFEWKSFGEALFWLKNIPNCRENMLLYKDNEFESGFKILDSKSLSKLMLGMYTYSPAMNQIREKYAKYFISRIKEDFEVIHLTVDKDEVNVHYIIDILANDSTRSTNDYIVNILGIIRTALPDYKMFCSQGYGHRLQTLGVNYDETHKAIPIENIPLEEWVGVNSSIIKLYEYTNRPKDWNEYIIKVTDWEALVKDKIIDFNKSFYELFKGSKNYTPLVPVMQNIFFKRTENIKEPKSITDPLGIFGGMNKGADSENERERLNKTLYSKYEIFFKSLSDFRGDIESFIQQSAQIATSRIKLKTEEGHTHNENMERLSQINLYSAIEKFREYNFQYKSTLGNIDATPINKLEINSLLTTATFWKDFLSNNIKGEHSFKRIFKLKSDFESRIIKDLKQASKFNSFSIRYINSTLTDEKPIVLIDAESPLSALMGMKEGYRIVQQAIGSSEHTSLKSLMLQLWFSNIFFIQTIYNKSINNQWNEVRLYTLKNKIFEELVPINLVPRPINPCILENLNIESWTKLYPEFNEIYKAAEAYGKLTLLVDHFYDLRLFDEFDLEEEDSNRLLQHIEKVGLEIQLSLQTVLDFLVVWIDMFPLDNATYITSEEEQEYFKAMLSIKDNIFPEPKGDEDAYQFKLNMEIISRWVKRLKVCSESWGIFLVLLYGKYINKYNQLNKS